MNAKGDGIYRIDDWKSESGAHYSHQRFGKFSKRDLKIGGDVQLQWRHCVFQIQWEQLMQIDRISLYLVTCSWPRPVTQGSNRRKEKCWQKLWSQKNELSKFTETVVGGQHQVIHTIEKAYSGSEQEWTNPETKKKLDVIICVVDSACYWRDKIKKGRWQYERR